MTTNTHTEEDLAMPDWTPNKITQEMVDASLRTPMYYEVSDEKSENPDKSLTSSKNSANIIV